MDISSIDANKLCLCFGLRRASRALTQRYDHVLSLAGLRSTQFNLLAGLASYEAKTLTQLASLLVMDRTTLTRNLKPLERAGLVITLASIDKRSRPYVLSEKGKTLLQDALPLWIDFQSKVHAMFGREYCEKLLGDFNNIVDKSKGLI
jgi:DNA-binding MarR family transcriptional regulator